MKPAILFPSGTLRHSLHDPLHDDYLRKNPEMALLKFFERNRYAVAETFNGTDF
jgi:hypothetical protein